jgi:Flp pilus assembly protein TadD
MVSQLYVKLQFLEFVCLVFIILIGNAPAQPPDSPFDTGLGGINSITGSVYGPTGQRFDRRIRIRLVTMVAGDRTSMTDDDGNFSFRGLPNGRFTILIDGEKEFEPFKQDINLLTLRGSPPQVYTMTIRLAVKKTVMPTAGVVNSEFSDVPKTALDYYKKAVELSKAQDHKGAIAQLMLATKEYPNFMLAFNDMGIEYLRMNDLERADTAFRSALKIKPQAFQPLMNLGIVLFNENRYDEAEPFLRDAVKVKDGSAVGHYFLGRTLANLGRFDEAVKELAAAVTFGGDEMKEAHRYLAIIYNAQGDKKRAASEIETYLRLVPDAPDAEQLRQVMEKLKKTDP